MSKLVKKTLTTLIALLVIGGITYTVYANMQEDPIEDLVKYSYETEEITTDLQGGAFLRIQFQIVTDGKKAKKEISQRDFQLKNILIKELANLTEEEFTNSLEGLEEIIQKKLNELMTEGKIIDVYTISKILQK